MSALCWISRASSCLCCWFVVSHLWFENQISKVCFQFLVSLMMQISCPGRRSSTIQTVLMPILKNCKLNDGGYPYDDCLRFEVICLSQNKSMNRTRSKLLAVDDRS